MKGHPFDWRVKRPPPFCLFVTGHAGLYGAKLTCEARMQRNNLFSHPDPLYHWWMKRGHTRFARYHVRHAPRIVFIGQIEVDDAMQFHRQPRR